MNDYNEEVMSLAKMPIGTPIPEGVRLLAYFMVNAPAEPQGWFMPTITIEKPVWTEKGTDEERRAYFKADCDYHAVFDKQRYLQWPRAWAEQILMQLNK